LTGRAARRIAWTGLPILYILHNDLWLWDDPRFVLGLPVGLLYHVGFCAAVTVEMWLLVRYAWPAHLEVDTPEEDRR
jgi:hypothetical protein